MHKDFPIPHLPISPLTLKFLDVSFTGSGGAAALKCAIVVGLAIVTGDLFTGREQSKGVEFDPLTKDPYKAVR